MKILLLALALAFSIPAFAQHKLAAPVRRMIDSQSIDGLHTQYLLRTTWDAAVQGTNSSAAIGLNAYLPAKAVITRSWIQVVTPLTSLNNDATFAVSCLNANNIKTATDIHASAAGAFIEGESTGAASAYKTSLTSSCQIKVTLGLHPVSAGKMIMFINYVIGGV